MLDLIYDYEKTRYRLQVRIHRLNRLLKNENLYTMERESLTVRRDLLTQERTEMLEQIIEMKKHLREEELSYAGSKARSGKRCRI